MKKIFPCFILAFLFAACNKEYLGVDRFFLKSEGAVMPVIISGNLSSKVFVVFLHGGPGDSAIRSYYDARLFEKLETDYAWVYWDQRCAGLSEGNCDPAALQPEDFGRDLSRLLKVIQNKYGMDIHIFLLGHSWGGTLGLDFLSSKWYDGGFRGFINIAGPHNMQLTAIMEKTHLLDFAAQMQSQGIFAADWKHFEEMVHPENPETVEGAIVINRACYDTERTLIRMDSIANTSVALPARNFLSSLMLYNQNARASQNAPAFKDNLLNYDLSGRLKDITLPVLVGAGSYDFVIPPDVMRDLYEKLGSQEKVWKLFKHSPHSPMVAEPEIFENEIRNFIEKYR